MKTTTKNTDDQGKVAARPVAEHHGGVTPERAIFEGASWPRQSASTVNREGSGPTIDVDFEPEVESEAEAHEEVDLAPWSGETTETAEAPAVMSSDDNAEPGGGNWDEGNETRSDLEEAPAKFVATSKWAVPPQFVGEQSESLIEEELNKAGLGLESRRNARVACLAALKGLQEAADLIWAREDSPLTSKACLGVVAEVIISSVEMATKKMTQSTRTSQEDISNQESRTTEKPNQLAAMRLPPKFGQIQN